MNSYDAQPGQILVFLREPSERYDGWRKYLRLKCGDLLRVIKVDIPAPPEKPVLTVEVCKDGTKVCFGYDAAQAILAPHVRFDDLPTPDGY